MSFAKFTPRPTKVYTGANPSAPRTPALRVNDGRARAIVQVPKDRPKRSEKYRRWVASLACAHCTKAAPTQCAHADEGKGMAIKSSDETCFPLCVKCHSGMGSEGWFSKEQRRHLESTYGARTRLDALANGHWPKGWA